MRIVLVEFGRLDEAHHDSGALASAKGSGKEPVVAAQGHWPDTVLEMVVVDRQIAIVDVADQSCPATQGLLDCLGRSRAVRDLTALPGQPLRR